MACETDRSSPLEYAPAEAGRASPVRRLTAFFLRMLPWWGLYAVMFLAACWLIFGLLAGDGDMAAKLGGLALLLWLGAGLCVVAWRKIRRLDP